MKEFVISVAAVILSGLIFITGAVIYPVKIGEVMKQVEINSEISNSYKCDISRLEDKLNCLLVEVRELKVYIKTKEGKGI